MAVTALISAKTHVSRTLALVLAGGRGSRLHGLTDERAKPAVPFGGKYRLIDFALSNALNSQVGKVGVLTQYKPQSLNKHIEQGWNVCAANGTAFVQMLPSQTSGTNGGYYTGTADAIFKNLDFIRAQNPGYVLVLAGDHIYKMDYTPLIECHVQSGADMTISAVETSLEEGKNFGVLSVDDQGTIVGFNEKPSKPEPIPGRSGTCLSSMGVYVFNFQYLVNVLAAEPMRTLGDDFGHDFIPRLIKEHRVMAYAYSRQSQECDYWRDVGTIDSFWQANIELIGARPPLDLGDSAWPIRARSTQAPPARFVFDSAEVCGAAVNSLICDGCVISGALVKNSVLCNNVAVDEQSHIIDSVILPDCTIGKRCSLRRVLLDQDCVLPDGTVIGYNIMEDARRFEVTASHVVLVTQAMLDAERSVPLSRAA